MTQQPGSASPDAAAPQFYEWQRLATSHPGAPREQYYNVRNFANGAEKEGAAAPARWPHLRPDSVLIAAIGFHWAQGSWQKVLDMLDYYNQHGVYAALSEVQDRCFEPYDALGTMRNEAANMARNEGFEWICYVDNDIQPEPDTLIRLLQWQLPIVAPYVVEPGTGKRLFGPGWEPNQGLKPVRWSVLSMLLMKTAVFNCFGTEFWADAIGADEGFHFQKLWHYGHRPWVDTNTHLVVGGAPHYPLASNRLPSAQRAQLWDRVNEKRNMPPDRRPIDPNNVRDVVDGQYLPFIARQREQEAAAQPAAPGTAAPSTESALPAGGWQ